VAQSPSGLSAILYGWSLAGQGKARRGEAGQGMAKATSGGNGGAGLFSALLTLSAVARAKN